MVENIEMVMPDFCDSKIPMHYTTALSILIKLGIDISRINLLALGEYENYKGEIREQYPQPGEVLNENSEISLKVGFPSAVDFMPYQFFYGLKGYTSYGGKWEEKARAVMAPFDGSVIRYNGRLKYEELKNNLGVIEYNHLAKFSKLFYFDHEKEESSFKEAFIWSTLFPTFHLWSGNAQEVCKVLNALFDLEFKIIQNTPMTHQIPSTCLDFLGSNTFTLGQNTLIGDTFTERNSGYEVVLLGVDMEAVENLLPNGIIRRKIEKALEVMMPGNLEYKIIIKTNKHKSQIGTKKKENYLGYTSYLSYS